MLWAEAYLLFKPHDFIRVCDAIFPHLFHHDGTFLDSHLITLAASEEVVVLMLELWVVQNQVLCKEVKKTSRGSLTPSLNHSRFQGRAIHPQSRPRTPILVGVHVPPKPRSAPNFLWGTGGRSSLAGEEGALVFLTHRSLGGAVCSGRCHPRCE